MLSKSFFSACLFLSFILCGCAQDLTLPSQNTHQYHGIASFHFPDKTLKFHFKWHKAKETHVFIFKNSLGQKVLQIKMTKNQLSLSTLQGIYHDKEAQEMIESKLGLSLDWQKFGTWLSSSELKNTNISGFDIKTNHQEPNTVHLSGHRLKIVFQIVE